MTELLEQRSIGEQTVSGAPAWKGAGAAGRMQVALVGNPNSGKTTLFNALTGMRMHTSNFSGTTTTRKTGNVRLNNNHEVELLDIPGIYSMQAASTDEEVAVEVLQGSDGRQRPDAIVLVMDATNLERSIFLLSQVSETEIPIVIAVNMVDLAEKAGIKIDTDSFGDKIGGEVVPIVARSGEGLEDLKTAIAGIADFGVESYPRIARPSEDVRCGVGCHGCPFHGRFTWSEQLTAEIVKSERRAGGDRTEKLDAFLTHPVFGVASFVLMMWGVFYLIFELSGIPMDLIEGLFGGLGEWVGGLIPAGDVQGFIVDGLIGGVGGVLVFLPQICILFFVLALLEGTGYFARAAFVMDRLMRFVGLPGTAFVPMLSGHACAIPVIMSTRVIGNWRDRLVTILILPLMSCSARMPVYGIIAILLFGDDTAMAARMFAGAYFLGIAMALLVAFVFKKTILPGESEPLILELPAYKVPKLTNALHHTFEKGWAFVKTAGTTILAISVVLWVLDTYPKTDPSAEVVAMQDQAAALSDQLQAQYGEVDTDKLPEGALALQEQIEELETEAGYLAMQEASEYSVAGRIGNFIEPVVAPLGYDGKIGIAVFASFAAREVMVSSLSISYGMGEDGAEEENLPALSERLQAAKHADGTPVFTTASSVSLLVFFVLAMQCFPTQVVTRQETGTWKWPLFQFTYMTVLAYLGAFVAFNGLRLFGVE